MPFDSVAERLLKGGVAPRHVRRYIRELEDHFSELTTQLHRSGCEIKEVQLQARARLGDDAELASAMLELPQLRTWSARIPWLIFSTIPPAIAYIAFAIPFFVVRLVSPRYSFRGSMLIWVPTSYAAFTDHFVNTSNLLIAPAVSAAFAMIIFRQRLDRRWALLAAASIAVIGLQDCSGFSEHTTVGSMAMKATFWTDSIRELAKAWRLSTIQAVLTLLPAVLLQRWPIRVNEDAWII